MSAWRHFSGSMRWMFAHPLARATPLRSLLRYACWQFRSRLGRPPFLVPFVDDTRAEVERGGGSALAAFLPLHEYDEMRFLLLALRPGDLLVDVGANVGLHTLLAAACGAEVVALEPLPAARAMLERNVARNGLAGRVLILAAGAADARGELTFTDGPSCLNHVVGPGEVPGVPVRKVPVVPLDEVVPSGRPVVMLKIDVEGFEAAVLRGATRLLADPALRAVIVETQGYDARYGRSGEVLRLLTAAGFVAVHLEPGGRTLTDATPGAPSANTILVRREAMADLQARIASAPRRRVLGRWAS
jgi:FkbM family methyltransferase